MRLFISLGMSGALGPITQLQHRRTAIEYAVAGITRQHELNVVAFHGDPFFRELEATMRDWVVETILQGAYLREYHLWEKDCKDYFREMARRNGGQLRLESKKAQRFSQAVVDVASRFGVNISADCIAAIGNINARVNIMKHDEGLEIEHFITLSDYESAMNAFEKFWNLMLKHETFVAPGSLP